MMSIALRTTVQDQEAFGGSHLDPTSDGRDVDVELGELRYGERMEMLVELELDNTDITPDLRSFEILKRSSLVYE